MNNNRTADLLNRDHIKYLFSIFENNNAEIRLVGGCIRDIFLNKESKDIDTATVIEPNEVLEILNSNNIEYDDFAIQYGSVIAYPLKKKVQITTLREDINQIGRHTNVAYTLNWEKDAARRDFTFNAMYLGSNNKLYDYYNGKDDLIEKKIRFIGETQERIKEDYLRILRYVRFYLLYSKQPHNSSLIRKFKINIDGVSKISKDRLLDELKKIIKSGTLEKLSKDKISLDLIQTIFPELRNIHIFSKLKLSQKEIIKKSDLIFLISLMIIDDTDNADYFLYKFNLSKKDQIRIKLIDNFFKEKKSLKKLNEKIMNKVFYYNGKQSALDIISFKIIKSKNIDDELFELSKIYLNKSVPTMPISAELLMQKYKIPEGKQLGVKLKNIEEVWVDHNFQITDQQLENILNN